jgi:enamine deaminase RidA (YjgF/YER057c/UK114 family)
MSAISRERPDAASALLQDIFGKDKCPRRLVYGVASLPLGTPVELKVIFEVGVQERMVRETAARTSKFR